MENKITMPRPPKANTHNRDQFCNAWMNAYGGTYRNALRVYQVELAENCKVKIQRYDISTGKLVEEWTTDIDYRNPDMVRCELCGNTDCTCSDFDIDPDMGDK